MFQTEKMTLQVFKNVNVSVNSVISNVLAVSLSIDVLARFVSLSSVIVDLWNVLISLNLLKLRSAVLYTVVIGKLWLEWPKTPFRGRPQKLFHGKQSRNFAYNFQVADDAMYTDVHKALAPFYGNSHKKCTSLAAIAEYIAISWSYKIVSADFSSRVLFHKEANCHGL